jgi:hypothetical protein
MIDVCIRSQPTVAGMPAIAATAAETSSDYVLAQRISAGNKPAMQALGTAQAHAPSERVASRLLDDGESGRIGTGEFLRRPNSASLDRVRSQTDRRDQTGH